VLWVVAVAVPGADALVAACAPTSVDVRDHVVNMLASGGTYPVPARVEGLTVERVELCGWTALVGPPWLLVVTDGTIAMLVGVAA
jgi:hypothetical protein